MHDEIISSVGVSVQPLVFETGLSEYPYSTQGTVFMVGYAGRAFVVTARHLLRPDDCPAICIFPSDASQQILPLNDVFFVSSSHVPDDFMDVAVIEIDMKKITDPELGNARVIDLSLASGDWLSESETVEMFVLGYPEEHSFVDYDQEILINCRWALHGRYAGPSEVDYLHKFEVSDKHTLSTFSGFSGGPVFAWINPSRDIGQIVLCGMALRGTSSSGLIHFLDRSVLLDTLKVKIEKVRK